jgi:hypothetical protein
MPSYLSTSIAAGTTKIGNHALTAFWRYFSECIFPISGWRDNVLPTADALYNSLGQSVVVE